jgi:hypothetical protein
MTRQDKTSHSICPTPPTTKPKRTDLGCIPIGKGHSSDRGTGQEMVRKCADSSKQEINGKGYTWLHSCLCLCVGLGLDLCLFDLTSVLVLVLVNFVLGLALGLVFDLALSSLAFSFALSYLVSFLFP